jgi:hypothetical protein
VVPTGANESIRFWIETRLRPEFNNEALKMTPTAILVIQIVLEAQMSEGLVSDQHQLISLMDAICPRDIVNLYFIKYGRRTLTTNRAIRLLADMHDMWIAIRTNAKQP